MVTEFGLADKKVTKVSVWLIFGRFLEGFPLVHEVPDLPHQALVTGNRRFGDLPVVVEARCRHLGFEGLDGFLTLGDPAFQLSNPPVPVIVCLLAAAGFGVRPFLLVVGLRRLGRGT